MFHGPIEPKDRRIGYWAIEQSSQYAKENASACRGDSDKNESERSEASRGIACPNRCSKQSNRGYWKMRGSTVSPHMKAT